VVVVVGVLDVAMLVCDDCDYYSWCGAMEPSLWWMVVAAFDEPPNGED
jgi:hypothetical protein